MYNSFRATGRKKVPSFNLETFHHISTFHQASRTVLYVKSQLQAWNEDLQLYEQTFMNPNARKKHWYHLMQTNCSFSFLIDTRKCRLKSNWLQGSISFFCSSFIYRSPDLYKNSLFYHFIHDLLRFFHERRVNKRTCLHWMAQSSETYRAGWHQLDGGSHPHMELCFGLY